MRRSIGRREANFDARPDADGTSLNSAIYSIDHVRYRICDQAQRFELNNYSAKQMPKSLPNQPTTGQPAAKPFSAMLLPLKLNTKRQASAMKVHSYGRSLEMEHIDNLREQLINIKKSYFNLSKENLVLKTRLRRLGSELGKKDQEMKYLLFLQSKGSINADEKGGDDYWMQKMLATEVSLKQKCEELSNAQELIKNRSIQQKDELKKLKNRIDVLETENEMLRKKLHLILANGRLKNNEIMKMERGESIGKLFRTKDDDRKKEITGSYGTLSRGSQSRRMRPKTMGLDGEPRKLKLPSVVSADAKHRKSDSEMAKNRNSTDQHQSYPHRKRLDVQPATQEKLVKKNISDFAQSSTLEAQNGSKTHSRAGSLTPVDGEELGRDRQKLISLSSTENGRAQNESGEFAENLAQTKAVDVVNQVCEASNADDSADKESPPNDGDTHISVAENLLGQLTIDDGAVASSVGTKDGKATGERVDEFSAELDQSVMDEGASDDGSLDSCSLMDVEVKRATNRPIDSCSQSPALLNRFTNDESSACIAVIRATSSHLKRLQFLASDSAE